MRKLKRIWHRVFLLLCAALVGCGDQSHPAAEEQHSVHLIEPMQVQEASLEQVYRVPGNVTADDSIQLSSRITGFIQSVAVREGDRVSQGDLLVEIDSADVQGAIRSAEAALASAINAILRTPAKRTIDIPVIQ